MTSFTLNNKETALPSKTGPGKGKGMDDETFEGAFRAAAIDASDYIDGFIAPLRAEATKYYRGEPFGDEEVGRSQIVMTEVRDAVLGVLPSLLRIFVSGDNVVEFVPENERSIDLAEVQTCYVNHVFYNDNPGFMVLYSAFKDALTRKTGIIKWRWSDDTTVSATNYTGLTAEQVAFLKEDPTVQVLAITQGEPIIMPAPEAAPAQPGQPQPPAPPPPPIPTFDVETKRVCPKNRLVIEALPPEEYLVNRDARDANAPGGFNFQAHRAYKTVSDLVAMGYDEEDIIPYTTDGPNFLLNYEAQARNPATLSFMGQHDTPDQAMRPVLFTEAYVRIDKDGDGIAELRKVHAVGDQFHILDDEIVDDAPFAVFCPDPEPHMVIGQSVADQTMDLQRIKTNMVRALLDSLAGSIHPRTVVVEGQVNLDDAMNTEQGAIIRTKQIAAVQELAKPFVGQNAMPVIAYVDQIKAKRTGVSDASQGLDPDVLQSTTKAAVNATVSGAQERIELYARVFAETGMKRLFKGVAACLREHQDSERMVKLAGRWVSVDPRKWEGELEVVPNVALGKGSDADKLGFLAQVVAKQEQIMQVLGPTNPLAGIDRYRNTLIQMMTLGGYKDGSRYFGPITPEFLQKLEQAAQNPKPDPATIIAQAEVMKVQFQNQQKQAELQAKAWEAHQNDQRMREEALMRTLVEMAKIEAQHGREINDTMLDRMLKHEFDMAQMNSNQLVAMHGNMTGLVGQQHGDTLKAHVTHTNNTMADAARREAMQAKMAQAAAAQQGGGGAAV